MGELFAFQASETLRLQTYCNWQMDAPLPMIWRCTEPDVNGATVYRRQALTLLGNEPERIEQSATTPADFVAGVRAYQRRNPTPIALPGILMHDAKGLDWLDLYLSLNGPLPDFWAIHIYAWTADDWRAQWRKFQDWMWSRQTDVRRPVIVTECASWGDRVGEQVEVMDTVWDVLQTESRLAAALWFSAHCATNPGHEWWARSDVLNAQGELTDLGKHFMALTQGAEGASVEPQVLLPQVSA